MRKWFCMFLAIFMIASTGFTDVSAAGKGKEKAPPIPPVIKTDKMILPTTPIAKGKKAEVQWDCKDGILTIKKNHTTLVVDTRNIKVTVNGNAVDIGKYANGKYANKKNRVNLFGLIMDLLKNSEGLPTQTPVPSSSPTPTPGTTSSPIPPPTPTPAVNLALNKRAVASTFVSGNDAGMAVDGKKNTRWSSEYTDIQWIFIDLGQEKTVGRVVLQWDAAYGRKYQIQTSLDAENWSAASIVASGDGGLDDISFPPVKARYVRLLGLQRATQWGYSLREFEVYEKGVHNGALTGTIAVTPQNVSLSSEGTKDWVHWGYGSVSGFIRKSGVEAKISNFTKIGNSNATWVTSNPVQYSWEGGTPVAFADHVYSSVYVAGQGNGFQFSVPADTNMKTLKVYLGAWGAKGKIEAFLSDGSSTPYIGYIDSPSGISCQVFTLNFKAASAGQSLIVKYTADKVHAENFGNITMQAATLQ